MQQSNQHRQFKPKQKKSHKLYIKQHYIALYKIRQNILIEIMNSILKPLYQLITKTIQCEQRLQHCKLSYREGQYIFRWLDQRKRNFIDLSDIYIKFQHLNQEELFYVFKYLDVKKKGFVTLDNLLESISVSNDNNNEKQQNNQINKFINLIKALKAAYHFLQEQKQKLSITEQYLSNVFNLIVKNSQNKINVNSILGYFQQEGFFVNQQIVLFFGKHTQKDGIVDRQLFINIFKSNKNNNNNINNNNNNKQIQNNSEIQKIIPSSYLKHKNSQQNKACNNWDVNKILQKYRKISKNDVDNLKIKQNQKQPQIQIQIKKENGIQQNQKLVYLYGYSIKNKYGNKIEYINNCVSPQIKDIYENLQSEFEKNKCYENQQNYFYKEISKRRQELRRGSVERQKIMNDVVNWRNTLKTQIAEQKVIKQRFASQQDEPKIINPRYTFQQISTESQVPSLLCYEPYRHVAASSGNVSQKPPTSFLHQSIKLNDGSMGRNQRFLRSISSKKFSNLPYTRQSLPKQAYNRDINLCKGDLFTKYYKKNTQYPKTSKKENILRRAQEEANKKIQEIQKKARLKVMEKRNGIGSHYRWIK